MDNKYILIIDVVTVLGSLLVIAGLVNYTQPLLIAPLNNYQSSNTSVLFEFENAELILIDDTIEFTSPLEVRVRDNTLITLKPGTYYWKAVNPLASDIRQLTIVSTVDLRLEQSAEGYEVVNAGNTVLELEVYRNGALTKTITIDPATSHVVSGDTFIGRQDA